ncbi:hypothetical protein ES703_116343 [subsurface metagenome]
MGVLKGIPEGPLGASFGILEQDLDGKVPDRPLGITGHLPDSGQFLLEDPVGLMPVKGLSYS